MPNPLHLLFLFHSSHLASYSYHFFAFCPAIPISVSLVLSHSSFPLSPVRSPHSISLFPALLAFKLLFLPRFSVLADSLCQLSHLFFLHVPHSESFFPEISFFEFSLRILVPAILTLQFQKTSSLTCPPFRLTAFILYAVWAR